MGYAIFDGEIGGGGQREREEIGRLWGRGCADFRHFSISN